MSSGAGEATASTESLAALKRPEILAGVFFVAAFALFVFYALPLLTFPYELRYGEGVVLDQVRRVHEEPGLYPPFDEPPYLIGNYPPVYPAVTSLLPTSAASPFFAGRLLSTVSVVLSAALILLIVRRFATDAAGLVAGGVFLLLPEINEFGPLMRIDSLALALGLFGFYATTVDDDARAPKLWRFLGAVAFFLSVYTRHSMLSLPLASYAILFGRTARRAGHWRAGLTTMTWPLGLLAAGATAFLIANVVADGEPYGHLIFLNRLPYQWDRVEMTWFASMYPWRYPLAAAALFAVWPERVDGHERRAILRLGFVVALAVEVALAIYFVATKYWSATGLAPQELLMITAVFHAIWFSVVLASVIGWTGIEARDRAARVAGALLLCGGASALLIGRIGSDVNYLFEYYSFGAIAIGLAVARLRGRKLGSLLVLLGIYAVGNVSTYPSIRTTRPGRLSQIEGRQAIIAKLVDLPGKVLSQDPALVAMLGRPVEYQPFMYRQLADNGVWDPAALVRAVRNQEFAAIVVVLHQPYAWRETVGGRAVPQFGPKVENAHTGFPKEVIEAYRQAYQPDPSVVVSEMVNEHYRELRYLLVPKED